MTEQRPQHCTTAMAILTSGAALRSREGQFLGGLAFDINPPTEKQENWLRILAEKHLPGGDHE